MVWRFQLEDLFAYYLTSDSVQHEQKNDKKRLSFCQNIAKLKMLFCCLSPCSCGLKIPIQNSCDICDIIRSVFGSSSVCTWPSRAIKGNFFAQLTLVYCHKGKNQCVGFITPLGKKVRNVYTTSARLRNHDE
jgi:hypothetical protein